MKLKNYNSQSAILFVSAEELKSMQNVLLETTSQIDDWEFQTLIGFDKERATELITSIEQSFNI